MSEQVKKTRGSIKGGSLNIGGEKKVFKKTHVKKKENESDPNGRVYGRGSGMSYDDSSQVYKSLDGVTIIVMLDQIAKLTATLAQSMRRRLADQESMSDSDDESVEDDDDFIDCTLSFHLFVL
ncbi:hypothetical protein H5410_050451 [Solanum commersonii]|uniref:Uncharacterized protein n=1 Tax=Solanum commersonii TaxID=4109 RepID=A0A9J5WXW9_SOLCO|nr:hypothetical protein H5410_050451 [Solanum commersonii]